MKKILLIASFLIFLLCSCQIEDNPMGQIMISVNQDGSKGISPVVMDASYYAVTLNGPGNEVIEERIQASETRPLYLDVHRGEWNVSAIAYNKSDQPIGSGSNRCVVKAGKITACNLIVREYTGTGTLDINVSTKADMNLTARIYTAAEYSSGSEPSIIVPLVKGVDNYTLSRSLEHGFYHLEIVDSSVTDGVPFISESVRIVKGYSSRVFVSDINGTIEVTITNNVIATPKIEIISSVTDASYNKPFSFEAKVTGVQPVRYEWLLDNEPVGCTSNIWSGTITPDLVSEGKHIVSCMVYGDEYVWDQSLEFEIGKCYVDGDYFATIIAPWNKSYAYIQMKLHDGIISYSVYRNEDRICGDWTSDFSVHKTGDDIVISCSISYFSSNCSFIIKNGDFSQIGLFSTGGGGEPYNCKFEPYKEMNFTESWCERDSSMHIRTLISPEYGTYYDENTREKHTLNSHGRCTKCGYNSTKKLYEMCDNIRGIEDDLSNASIEVCRYWPGVTALSDGATIQGTDKLYIKKRMHSPYLTYQIYIPKTITEQYVAKGGCQLDRYFNGFDWYLEKALGINDWRTDQASNVVKLFGSTDKLQQLNTLNSPQFREKIKVSTTGSAGYKHFRSFGVNDIVFTDGTSVTDFNRFYISEDGYLMFPVSLYDALEMGGKDSPSAWNAFVVYLMVYYPNMEMGARDWELICKTLLETPFNVPDYKDYQAYFDRRR